MQSEDFTRGDRTRGARGSLQSPLDDLLIAPFQGCKHPQKDSFRRQPKVNRS
jgi:hypothetical protein